MSSINITPNNTYKISMRANNITSNFGDNFTIDASNSLISFRRNAIQYAYMDTSFNFTNLPSCSVVPSLGSQLTNKTYVDSLVSGSSSATFVNQSTNLPTYQVSRFKFSSNKTFTNSSITANIDTNVSDSTFPQVYTFGTRVQTRILALAFSPTNWIAYSDDGGFTWTGLGKTNLFGTNGGGRDAIYIGTRWIAGGTGTNTIIYSNDNGLTWTAVASSTSIFATNCLGFAYNGSRLVAVGNGTNSMAYSDDGGITWTGLGASSPFGTTGIGYDVAWNGARFVAVGQGTNTLAFSNGGTVWTPVASIFSSLGQSIVWTGRYFIAQGIGTNVIAQSADGITWIGRGTSVGAGSQCLAWNGQVLCTGCSGSPFGLYSLDGGWTYNNSTFATIGSDSPGTNNQVIIWDGSKFLMGSTLSTTNQMISYSYNGITWFPVPNTGTTLFGEGSSVYGLSVNRYRPNTITFNYGESTGVVNISGGSLTTNDLEVISLPYYNKGYSNFCASFN